MNMRLLVTTALLVTTTVSTSVAAMLQVDPAHSSVTFEATHLKLTTIPGKFGEFSGSIDLNDKDITKSTVEFTVQIASINTNVGQRDDHLRSADFFDAKTHPQATFTSTSIKKAGKSYRLEGNLTIRGVVKKVTFDVQSLGKAEDPVMKTTKHVFKASTVLNRKDFGVNYGPDAIVGDKVPLHVNLEAMPKVEAAPDAKAAK